MSYHFGAEVKQMYPLLHDIERLLHESTDVVRENLLAVLPFFTGDTTTFRRDSHYAHLCRIRRITDGLQEGDDEEHLTTWTRLLHAAEAANRIVTRRGLVPATITYQPLLLQMEGDVSSYNYEYCDIREPQMLQKVSEAFHTLSKDGYGVTVSPTIVQALLNPLHTITYVATDDYNAIRGLVIGTNLTIERQKEKVCIFYVWFCCRSSSAAGLGLVEACKNQFMEDHDRFKKFGIQYYAAHFPKRIPYLSNMVGELQPELFFECPSPLFKQEGRLYLKEAQPAPFEPNADEVGQAFYQRFRSEVWFFTAWWHSKQFYSCSVNSTAT